MRIITGFAITFSLFVNAYGQKFNSEIDKDEIKDHIGYLASEELAGRKPGTDGDKAAAEYIRKKFEEAGLKLLGENGLQYFEITSAIKLGEGNYFRVGKEKVELSKDYTPLSFSGNKQLKSSIVFVGYGFSIKKDSISWDDYAKVDVKDKWVLVFRADPDLDNPHSPYAQYSTDRYKVMNAVDHGAAGVILVNTKEFDKSDALVKVKPNQGIAPAGIPVVQVKREIADKIFNNENHTVEVLEKKISESNSIASFSIDNKVDCQTEVIPIKENTMNVVGFLEGKGNSEEYLVVGGHYDHLGMGGPTSRTQDTIAVHYGADDNASGVSLIIELAQKASVEKPDRDVLFIAFGAEEMGLLGSAYYVANPLLKKENAKAMFNIDMVGRLNEEKFLSISGTGTAVETDSLLAVGLDTNLFSVTKSLGGTGPSDHSSFYTEGIPVLFFSTGVHDDYHTPFDRADKINYKGTELVGNAIFDLLTLYGEEEQVLTYKKSGTKQGRNMRRRMKVTLGIVPHYAASEVEGLGVGGVRAGGPAETGGMQKGDIIVGINGKAITNIYDYMYRLATFSKGQRITVEIKRGEEKKLLIIEL